MEQLLTPLIWSHVGLGTIAVLAGAVALAVKKGKANHIRSGQIFAASMGLSSLIGAILGLVRAEELYITFHGGVLGVSLIASSVLTLRSKAEGLHGWALTFGAINTLNFAALIGVGSYALTLPEGQLMGFYGEDYLFLGAMAGAVVIGDLRLLIRKTLSRPQRIARHLWRMCLGFFIAAGSAFTGPGMKVFPESIQDSGLLSLPELIIFLLMLFWLARTLLKKAPRSKDNEQAA